VIHFVNFDNFLIFTGTDKGKPVKSGSWTHFSNYSTTSDDLLLIRINCKLHNESVAQFVSESWASCKLYYWHWQMYFFCGIWQFIYPDHSTAHKCCVLFDAANYHLILLPYIHEQKPCPQSGKGIRDNSINYTIKYKREIKKCSRKTTTVVQTARSLMKT